MINIHKIEIDTGRPVYFTEQPIKQVYDIQIQKDKLVMWYAIDPLKEEKIEYVVFDYWTGYNENEYEGMQYIKTMQFGDMVSHYFICKAENYNYKDY